MESYFNDNRGKEKGKAKLSLSEMLAVSGGTGETLGVSINDDCHKEPGTFKSLRNENVKTCKCRDCWHLKFNNGFYCDA